MRESYDVIVIGGGHAGAEAAWAAASALAAARGDTARVALITMDPARIGQMSCNPSIGGLGKGQMVREIDALGGIMGQAIDATGIMFKMLNTSRGSAVHGPRAQADKYAYAAEVQRLISTRRNIDVIAGTIDDVIVEDGRTVGVRLPAGAHAAIADDATIERNQSNNEQARPVYGSTLAVSLSSAPTKLRTSAVVLTTGTFMRALMHTGEKRTEGGRVGEGTAKGISATLRGLGFELGRLKTGTPPRLARESLDWDALPIQLGDTNPVPFSDLTLPSASLSLGSKSRRGDERAGSPKATRRGEVRVLSVPEAHVGASPRGVTDAGSQEHSISFPFLPQIDCRITQTTAAIHDTIRANLHRAPMYAGNVDAECGPRYCPSIEDKVVRFADRTAHHVFLEPESLHTNEIYCNGISTSLPTDVQELIVRGMPGCERAEILRWGYAVEYDMVWPHQINATCMTKKFRGLFFAGQINCTTGYEEAGAQGVIAGLNAARFALQQELVTLGRDQAYIGVMMDDLVTRQPREPYRMFTSRAEYRLLLRADNADERLTPMARGLGLVDDERWAVYESNAATLTRLRRRLSQLKVNGTTLRDLCKRPETTVEQVKLHLSDAARATAGRGSLSDTISSPSTLRSAPRRLCDFSPHLIRRLMNESKYDGYVARQTAEIKRQQKSEHQTIPSWLIPGSVPGLRSEARETLERFRPATMGQASRLPGVTPADLTLIAVAIKRGASAHEASGGILERDTVRG
jgi:tRNA uridine 5-carboxymethylaminomethyl modification enzyme